MPRPRGCHPARSRRVQALHNAPPAWLSPCAQSQGPGPAQCPARVAVTLRAVAGSRPCTMPRPRGCHPARSRRVQALHNAPPAWPSPCAQSQGPGPAQCPARVAVTLRAVAGSRPCTMPRPRGRHPARSRRVQALHNAPPAWPSPCAQSQGPGPAQCPARVAVTLRAVAGSRPCTMPLKSIGEYFREYDMFFATGIALV